MQSYEELGQSLMHLQKGLEDFDVFVRTLAIGPQTMVMHYDPSQPMHARYLIDFDFLSPEMGRESEIVVKVINAFFRWEFNSCESILKDGLLQPIDFANACPDIADHQPALLLPVGHQGADGLEPLLPGHRPADAHRDERR